MWPEPLRLPPITEAEMIERGRRLALSSDPAITNIDMAAYLAFRRSERADAIKRGGCCGDEPDQQGHCKMGMCPLVSEALRIIKGRTA